MEVFDTYVGNVDEDDLETGLADADVETITIDEDRSRRSRFRTETDDGTEVGVVIGRRLQAGDVLSTGETGDRLILVALEPIEALVVDLADAADELATAVALGHAAGNRHWDMAIRGHEVLFPAAESEEQMLTTVEPHLPDGATLDREMVPTALFDDGAVGHGHDHSGHDHGHEHSHGSGHTHDYVHDRNLDDGTTDRSLSKFGSHDHHPSPRNDHDDTTSGHKTDTLEGDGT